MRTNYIQSPDGIVSAVPGSGILQQYGTTVPTDGTAGYVPGAEFFKIDGAAGQQRYVNEGSATSCSFKAMDAVGGLSVKCGVGTLDGTNPTSIVTGLATVSAITVTLHSTAAAPSATATNRVTIDFGNITGGNVPAYAWRANSASNGTPEGSTGTESFSWVAVGSV